MRDWQKTDEYKTAVSDAMKQSWARRKAEKKEIEAKLKRLEELEALLEGKENV